MASFTGCGPLSTLCQSSHHACFRTSSGRRRRGTPAPGRHSLAWCITTSSTQTCSPNSEPSTLARCELGSRPSCERWKPSRAPPSTRPTRKVHLANAIEELREFDTKLETVAGAGFYFDKLGDILDDEALDAWTSPDGVQPPPADRDSFLAQEARYDPDLNDGVRVNIAPLQKAGLLSADVIAAKDLAKAIPDRATWRSDERRWCREGKLPQPGWWDHGNPVK